MHSEQLTLLVPTHSPSCHSGSPHDVYVSLVIVPISRNGPYVRTRVHCTYSVGGT